MLRANFSNPKVLVIIILPVINQFLIQENLLHSSQIGPLEGAAQTSIILIMMLNLHHCRKLMQIVYHKGAGTIMPECLVGIYFCFILKNEISLYYFLYF